MMKIPYTETVIGTDETDDVGFSPEEINELRIPHTLELLAGIRAHYGALSSSMREMQRLLGDKSDPLNAEVAYMLTRSILHELEEMRKFAEIG